MLEQVKPSGAEKENKLYDEERPNKKLEDELRKKYSGIVYHYCSLDTFFKIVTNHTIRASNIRKSNDYYEIIGCVDSFNIAMKRACIKYMDENPDNESFKKFFMPKGMKKIDIDDIVHSAIDNESCTYYCACFSTQKDLLSQWITYADDGRGVAIAFKEAYFYDLIDYCHYKYAEIEYDLNDPNSDRLENIVQYIMKGFCDLDEKLNHSATGADYANVIFKVVNAMVYNAVFYKDTSFRAECERRLVFYPFGTVRNLRYKFVTGTYDRNQMFLDRMMELVEMGENVKKFYRKPIDFAIKSKKISSYVDFDFSKCIKYLVPEIILGPKCTIDDLDLKLFLVSNGFDLEYTKISHSKSSYQ